MKKKLSLIIALYIIAAFQYCLAQQSDSGYKVERMSDGYNCSSNRIFKSMKNEKDNLYSVSFHAYRFFDSERMILGIEIGTVGDQQVVSIARLHKNGEQVRSLATITLSNGHRFSCTIFVADITNNTLKSSFKTGQASLNFVCNEPVSCLTMLRQYDIMTIEIEGHVVNMQNTTVKSAEIINNLCINLMKVVGSPSSYGSSPSTSSYSRSEMSSQSYSGGTNTIKSDNVSGTLSHESKNSNLKTNQKKTVSPTRKQGSSKATGRWKEARSFSEGLAAVKNNNKWGFIDKTGKIILPCIWTQAGSFCEGLAFVADEIGHKGYIDKTGKIIVKLPVSEYSYNNTYDFHEGLACIKKDGKYGFIDRNGNVVIPCVWDDASYFSEGIAPVKDGETKKWGYIDKTGSCVIECKWNNEAHPFSDGLGLVRHNGTFYYIDKTGSEVLKMYNYKYSGRFCDGLAWVENEHFNEGFIDKSGNEVIPCQGKYSYRSFREGLAAFYGTYDWGFIDKSGNVVFSKKGHLKGVLSFSEGLAVVRDRDVDRCFFVDKTGKVIIQ